MGQRVVLETPAPEITAAANKHKVKTIAQLQLGDRIKAEGLMAIECKIKKDKRNKPRASMWLSFKIQKEWTFLGNPIDYEEDTDSDDSAGDSNMSESSDDESSDSDDDTHKADGTFNYNGNSDKSTTSTDTNTVFGTGYQCFRQSAAAPSVHAVTAAAAMAMTNSVSKTMATIKK
ncbi:hypothetical protein BGX24_009304 [Mortierella sp. AD032]|nr:hypothetical protein BGX24_009304 [Mortierella sp. AD032]